MISNQPDREQELNVLIRAKYPILYIVSWEERRIEQILRQAAAETEHAGEEAEIEESEPFLGGAEEEGPPMEEAG